MALVDDAEFKLYVAKLPKEKRQAIEKHPVLPVLVSASVAVQGLYALDKNGRYVPCKSKVRDTGSETKENFKPTSAGEQAVIDPMREQRRS
ncbi:MAG: hypothetical protein QXV32_00715 [Conexivisphaerales archaeon]